MRIANKILIFAVIALGLSAQAMTGNEHGNGGDICEDRFKTVADDIKTWILNGGSAGLQLPVGISYGQYNQGMLKQISAAKVSCTDDPIFIGNAEKTCKNYVASDGTVMVSCNTTRFMNTSQSDQYVLVHHEYAGLAGFEVNDAESSNYQISNQISGYLEDQLVKRLVVRPPQNPVTDPFDPASCVGQPISNDEMKSFFKPGEMTAKVGDVVLFVRTRRCNPSTGCTDWSVPSEDEVIFGISGCNSGYSSCKLQEYTMRRTGEFSLSVSASGIGKKLSFFDGHADSLWSTPVIFTPEGSFATKAEYGYTTHDGEFWYRNTPFIRHKEQSYNRGSPLNLSGLITRSCMRLEAMVNDQIPQQAYYFQHEVVAFSRY